MNRSSSIPASAAASASSRLMLAAICIGAFLSHFTAGVVNVSLPHFVSVFQTSLGTAQWITTGYLLVIASLLPVMGKWGDRYGYRRIHNAGYLLFGISSVLVAFSPHISVLLALRMVQAVGAAMFQATNIALITIHLPKEQRGRALGTVSTAVALGGMSGPVAGGFIAEWFSEVDSFTEGRETDFGPLLGRRKAYRFNFSDQHALPRTLAIPSVSTRLCFDSAAVTGLLAWLKALGLLRLLKRPLLRKAAVRLFGKIRLGSELFAVKIDARGSKLGKDTTVECFLQGAQEADITARVTAEVASAVYGSNSYPHGVYHIEQLLRAEDILLPLRQNVSVEVKVNGALLPQSLT